jgi:hypothetical protein
MSSFAFRIRGLIGEEDRTCHRFSLDLASAFRRDGHCMQLPHERAVLDDVCIAVSWQTKNFPFDMHPTESYSIVVQIESIPYRGRQYGDVKPQGKKILAMHIVYSTTLLPKREKSQEKGMIRS